MAIATGNLAAKAFDRREFARASDTYAAVLDQARELGDPTLLRTMSLNLALARIEQAETVGVQALLAEALAHCAAMHNWAVASFPTIGPALLANLRGQPRRAAHPIGASKVLRAIGNIPLPAAQAPFAARAIAMTQAALDEATYTALTDEGRRWTIQCLLDAAHEAW